MLVSDASATFMLLSFCIHVPFMFLSCCSHFLYFSFHLHACSFDFALIVHFLSFPFISFHFLSFPFISFPFISFHFLPKGNGFMAWPGDRVQQMVIAKLSLNNPYNISHCYIVFKDIFQIFSTKRQTERERGRDRQTDRKKERKK